jgi:hypothetical protein
MRILYKICYAWIDLVEFSLKKLLPKLNGDLRM